MESSRAKKEKGYSEEWTLPIYGAIADWGYRKVKTQEALGPTMRGGGGRAAGSR